jgi:hypothetical protein
MSRMAMQVRKGLLRVLYAAPHAVCAATVIA